MGTRVLICGVSTRAAAASAARAGFDVTTIDAYADRDQEPGVEARSMTRDFRTPYSATAAARAARDTSCDAVMYLSNFENHPRAVGALASGRALWGNPPGVLRRVRDPFLLADAVQRRGFVVPATVRRPGPAPEVEWRRPGGQRAEPARRWLLKPRASGGGHGIREWRAGDPIPRRSYLQERIDGIPGSIVFAASRGRVVPLGMSRQIVGDGAFGASAYRYCGSIMQADDARFGMRSVLFGAACDLAEAVAQEFELVGVNGIDFIARDAVPYPIEVNPRWSASMELVERACAVSIFAMHAAACASGSRRSASREGEPQFSGAIGKAIVFARHTVTIGDTSAWLDDPDVRDVPHAGERVPAGRPVCTVFAEAADAAACHAALAGRAARIYVQLDRWREAAA